VRQTAIAPFTALPASSGATINRSFTSGSVPAIWMLRASACVSLTNSGRPAATMLPMMPLPASMLVARICSATLPMATIAL
jgi:hypothetical protein